MNKLNLNFNQITVIDDYAFVNVTQLEILDLTHNNLRQVCNTIFSHTPLLNALFLSKNKLFDIPVIANLSRLQMLDLTKNNISSSHFYQSYQTLTALNTVCLSYNSIYQFGADDLIHLAAQNLQNFECKHCNITGVNETLSHLTSLQRIDLSYNFLSLKQLKLLIKSLSVSRNLKTLKLNQVISEYNLPSYFFQLFENIKLESLCLMKPTDYGTLRNNTFFGLKSLTFLSLKYSNLLSIESHAFNGLNNLKILHMEYTYLSYQYYRKLGNLFPANLQALYLSGNCIAKITNGTFNNLSQLKN